MRLFIAINLPAAERRGIAEAVAPLRAKTNGVSWVKEEALHLTMKFLGEYDDAHASRLSAALGAIAGVHRPIELEISGIGAFPHWRAPRVIWAGVGDSPKLEILHHEIESACADLGHELEGRPFRPHITVGRVRAPLDREDARALGEAARAISYSSGAVAESVDLMSSATGAGGSRYAIVAVLPLRGA
ncbi:MAG: RNA 2',3'-cyclic phosphodiesterase [Gemmatimonadota bacterium]|nr:RNA 2',3'-cyclic phosphodiesterase [Gemmatimonadota bacterium]